MALRIKQIDPDPPRLAPEQWDFRAGSAFVPKDSEIYAWLHYEYARSYKPIIARVEAIRKKQFKRLEFGFAHYLAQTFPEFPCKPWSKLPGSVIERALGPWPIVGYLPPSHPVDIFGAYTIEDFFQDAADEQLGGPLDNYAAIQINFKRDNETIKLMFGAWLEQRRRSLVGKHSEESKATRKGVKNPYLTDTSLAVPGRGSPKSLVMAFMKRLGGTRLLCAHNYNWALAEEASMDPRHKRREGLYSDGKSWTRAKIEAGALLRLLSRRWKGGVGELQAGRNPLFTENNAFTLLSSQGLRYMDLGKERTKIIDFLTANFVIPSDKPSEPFKVFTEITT